MMLNTVPSPTVTHSTVSCDGSITVLFPFKIATTMEADWMNHFPTWSERFPSTMVEGVKSCTCHVITGRSEDGEWSREGVWRQMCTQDPLPHFLLHPIPFLSSDLHHLNSYLGFDETQRTSEISKSIFMYFWLASIFTRCSMCAQVKMVGDRSRQWIYTCWLWINYIFSFDDPY